MIPKIIDSVCNLSISGDEIIVITMISRYFQVWNNIDEKFLKNFCYSLIFWNYFFWNYFLLTFTVFQEVLLSVMSLLLILLKKFFFLLLITISQRLCCLLYSFLSMSLFVFKNLFLRRDLFMISLFIFLFMKGAWLAWTYRFFMKACQT